MPSLLLCKTGTVGVPPQQGSCEVVLSTCKSSVLGASLLFLLELWGRISRNSVKRFAGTRSCPGELSEVSWRITDHRILLHPPEKEICGEFTQAVWEPCG